jgi:hypothetical protein
MATKRSQEGYLLIDHRNSPGITPEFIRSNNLDAPAVGAGVTYESAIAVCGHCSADVILNPQRTRERELCRSCDKYICDGCGAQKKAGSPCVPVQQRVDILTNFILKGH